MSIHTSNEHRDCRAPRGYKGSRRKSRPSLLYVTLGTLLAAAMVACGVGAPSDQGVPDAGSRPTADATPVTAPKGKPVPAKPKAAAKFGEGTHEVPGDIKPGKYRTTVPDDAILCYWARLKDLDGELGSIRANGNLSPGGKGLVVVKKSDAAVEFRGDCVWTAAS